jgi:transcriptional regulator of met regulon
VLRRETIVLSAEFIVDTRVNLLYLRLKQYVEELLKTARIKESSRSLGEDGMTAFFGKPLPSDVTLSDEQATQLEKLKEETSNAGR